MMNRKLLGCLIGMFIIGLGGMLLWLGYGIHVSLEAENTLHAYILVLDVVEQHVLQHDGRWPKSWEELDLSKPAKGQGIWMWPDDRARIAERIQIDFMLTTVQVVKMTPENFSAIHQVWPNYGPRESELAVFLENMRKSIAQTGVSGDVSKQ